MLIEVWRDPYDIGVNITKKRELEFNPGVTVLVGCNGAGKTTLLRNIEESCKKDGIPCHKYDNLSDGGTRSVSSLFHRDGSEDESSLIAALFASSEGEKISLNIRRQELKYKEFFDTGFYNNSENRLSRAFATLIDNHDSDKKESQLSNKRVLLYDATDSGMSIDNMQDLKGFFHALVDLTSKQGIELYVIVSANAYELCDGETCIDVASGKEVHFKTYNAYRNFILRSRVNKEKRIERQIAYAQKRHEKAVANYETIKARNEAKIEKLRESYDGAKSKHKIDYEIRELERQIENARREC